VCLFPNAGTTCVRVRVSALYPQTLVGRLVPGNEAEVMEVCKEIASVLHARFPAVVKHPSEYTKGSNNDKPA
jgi:hypothetical protein